VKVVLRPTLTAGGLGKKQKYKLEALKSDTPFYQHIGILKHLRAVAQSGGIYIWGHRCKSF
jgi:hypothetical protein